MSSECRIIDINVVNDTFSWTLQMADMEGHATPLARDTIPFNLDKLQEKTIEKFIELLQFLVDMSSKAPQIDGPTIDDMTYGVVETLGEHLYQVLFAGQTADHLKNALADIGAGDLNLLRIQFEFKGTYEKLASWPWEYLRTPNDRNVERTGRFLALEAQLVLNRSYTVASGGSTSFSMKTPRPVPVVLVVSSPHDLGPVVDTTVIETIQTLKDSGVISLNSLVEPPFEEKSPNYKPQASFQGLSTLLQGLRGKNQAPAIIHFIGHGRRVYDKSLGRAKGQLAFMGEDGCAEWIDDEKFSDLVATGRGPKLVFLQACESGLPDPRASVSGVAMQIAHKGILAVVAMQAKVKNSVASVFACKFYEALKTGMPVDWAVKEGRQAISNMDEQDIAFGTPVLYLKSYEGLIGEGAPKPMDDWGSGNKPPVRLLTITTCPRCNAPILRSDQKFCSECSLRLFCKECSNALDDPMAKFCGECSAPVEQQPWSGVDVSTRRVDKVNEPSTRILSPTGEQVIGKDVDLWKSRS